MADFHRTGTISPLATRAAATINGALWAVVTAAATLVTATSILHAAGLTMLPADPIVFLCAAAILFTRGLVDYRVEVARPGSLACPSASATLEAAFAGVIHRPLAMLTLGLSRSLFRTRQRGHHPLGR